MLEADRGIQQYMPMGVVYDFIDFPDNLEGYNEDYKARGLFIRLTAKY